MLPYYMKTWLLITLLTVFISACSAGATEKSLPDSLTSPAKLLDQGVYHYSNNNYAKAIQTFEKALLQYRSIDNQYGIASSSLNLAKTYMAINNNQIAEAYLIRSHSIIKQADLKQLEDHLQLLDSSLAIKTGRYDDALQKLNTVLLTSNINLKLAALKNRTTIAFLQNEDNKQTWLQQYKTLQNMHPENTASHHARILRFEAALSLDKNSINQLLVQSLNISQNLTARTAIAATLMQWATHNIENEKYLAAEDKILRALFIRHQLGDVKSSLSLLKQLQLVYQATDNKKQALNQHWIEKLSQHDFTDWENMFTDFDRFPGNKTTQP